MSDIIRDLQLLRCPRPHPGPPPAPARSPTPLSSHPERGAPQTPLARPAPARTKLAPAAAWAPRGLQAGLGPRRLGDRGLAGPGPPGLLPATIVALLGGRGDPGELRDAWVPRRSVHRWALAGTGVNPFGAAARRSRSRPRSAPQPPAPPPAGSPPPSPPSRCPAPSPGPRSALGQLAASPSSRGGEVGVSLKTGSWGAPPRTPRARGAQRGESPRRGAPNPFPSTRSGPGAYLAESRQWERGSIP